MTRRRLVVSARVKIIRWTVGVLALALSALVLAAWHVLSARADAMVNDELTHEAFKFRSFAESESVRHYSRPEDLLTVSSRGSADGVVAAKLARRRLGGVLQHGRRCAAAS